MNFLPEKKAVIIRKLACGESVNLQAITDVLNEHRLFVQSNSNNIYDLCCSAARMTLIMLPNFSFQMIRKGMGDFWRGVSKSMFLSIYDCLVPNAEKIITSLDTGKIHMQNQKITTWLHRYLRSIDEKTMIFFLRFVTGGSTVIPNERIKVNYIDQPASHVHPATCFKIINLPRQYLSFSQFCDNLNKYMLNESLWAVHNMSSLVED